MHISLEISIQYLNKTKKETREIIKHRKREEFRLRQNPDVSQDIFYSGGRSEKVEHTMVCQEGKFRKGPANLTP